MPSYDYECTACTKHETIFTKISERHKQKCDCGKPLKLIYKTPPMALYANSGDRAV